MSENKKYGKSFNKYLWSLYVCLLQALQDRGKIFLRENLFINLQFIVQIYSI